MGEGIVKTKAPLKISVITISLNAEDHIEQTIQSVLRQTWPPFEYIVVDGGSTDSTLSIINRYRDHIPRILSEKDDGIADAMNKGIALATGDYIVFLHADDYFKSDRSLENVREFLDETLDILACRIQFGNKLKVYRPRGFNYWINFKTGVFHQGVLCRRSLIEKLGGFDKQFRIAVDYDFFLRAYRQGASLVKAPVILSVMRDTGISSRRDWPDLKVRFEEEHRVHKKNCPSSLIGLVYRIYWLFYPPYRRVRNRIEERGSR